MRLLALSTAILSAAVGSAASVSVAVAASTTVLTIAGNTMVVKTPMAQELKGSLCAAPTYSCKPIPYRSGGFGKGPLEEGVTLLQQALTLTENSSAPVIVLAYSQGGMIATPWLEKYGDILDRGADHPGNEVTLVLFGSPQNGMGGLGPAVGSRTRTPTPTDTGYTVIEISREYDPESDYPTKHGNLFAVMNALSGFSRVHTDYTNVDIYDPNNLVAQRGGTFYLLIPTKDLPMLAGLRAFGLKSLAASISEWLKPLIDSAYDRSEYITVAQARLDGWDLPDILTPPNAAAQFRTVWTGADVAADAIGPEPDLLLDEAPALPAEPIETSGTDEFLANDDDMTEFLPPISELSEEITDLDGSADIEQAEIEQAEITAALADSIGTEADGVAPGDAEAGRPADNAPTGVNDVNGNDPVGNDANDANGANGNRDTNNGTPQD